MCLYFCISGFIELEKKLYYGILFIIYFCGFGVLCIECI